MKLFGSITELVSAIFRKDSQQITVRPNQATTYTAARDIQLPPQDANGVLVSATSTQTLTNKTIDGDDNTVQDLPITAIKTVLGDANKVILRDASGVPTSALLLNVNVGAGAAIDATKLGNGDVDNTELSRLNGLSGNITTDTNTQTLTNKTIDGDNNTVQDLALTTLKTVLGDANKVIRRDASGIVVSDNTIPNSSALVTIDATQDLSNKELTAPLVDDYLDINEEAAPSTPASGRVRVYAKTDKKLYKKDSTGLETSIGGSGAGEKNYVANPDESGNWVASGAGVTVATTTTAAVLPEESKLSGILITGVSGTDYVRYRFTADDSDKNKKLKIQFALKSAVAYATNDFKVEMYTNTASNYGGSYVALQVQTNSQIPKNDAGAVLQYTFDSDTSDYYELRITRVTGTSNIVISGVIVGPGIVAQGAIVSDPLSYTPNAAVNQGFGTLTNVDLKWQRIGDSMKIVGQFTTGTVAAAEARLALPDGFTIFSGTGNRTLGRWYLEDAIAADIKGGQILTAGGNGYLTFGIQETANAVSPFANRNGATQFTSTTRVHVEVTIPITQWQGQGTVNLLQENNLSVPTSYIPTFTGLGTVTGINVHYTRVGSKIRVQGGIKSGTVAAASISMSLPTGLTINTTSHTPNQSLLGVLSANSNAPVQVFSNGDGFAVFNDTSDSTKVFICQSNDTTGNDKAFAPQNGSAVLNNNSRMAFFFEADIVEWANSQNALVGFAGATNTSLGLTKLPGDYVYVNTGNGNGSTATRRRRFSGTATTVGTAVTYAMSAANGSTFTISQRGVYAVNYGDQGSAQWGAAIARNTNGTTNPGSLIALTQRLTKQTIAAGFEHVMNWTGVLEVGDVVEMINDTAANDTTDQDFVYIVQVAKL